MQLVALDLEGTGAQDRENEAILEIALIRTSHGRLDMATAYTTLINPGRPIPRRPWISTGLTDRALAPAPPLSDVEPHLVDRLNGTYLVGHNVAVDWRLLHRRCPALAPAGLIDTLRLARLINHKGRNDLTSLITQFDLTNDVNRHAAGSKPHRALWDTIAAALLLHALAVRILGPDYTPTDLLTPASLPLTATAPGPPTTPQPQSTLFD